MFDVIVVGGGPSGVTAALRARELGANVALLERARLGGTCTNDGCVPTRVLAKAARLAREAHHFPDYGLFAPPPTLDFERLIARVQSVVYKIHEKKQIKDHLAETGIQVYEGVGAAAFIDPHNLGLPDGGHLQAEKFILCVGGRARRISFPGSEHALTHHDVWSLKRLPASVAIVGGAATGCQLASIFAAFGVQVRLLEVHASILGAEDELVSKVMREAFEDRGIQVITSINGIESLEPVQDGLLVRFSQQGSPQSFTSQAVVLAVGWAGNFDTLNLEAAGVKAERSYIVVNDYMQTSAPHIFAAGDITGRMMLVQSGSYDGRLAAENAVLGVGQAYRHSIVPHGGFTDPEYGSVGLTEAQVRAAGVDYTCASVPYLDLDRAVIDGHSDGFCKLIVSQENHRILGAHIVGEQALESIQLVAAGMASDMWVEQLAELEIAYPTYAAAVGLAARRIVHKLGVMPVSPQWRTLGRPHAEWERSATSLD